MKKYWHPQQAFNRKPCSKRINDQSARHALRQELNSLSMDIDDLAIQASYNVYIYIYVYIHYLLPRPAIHLSRKRSGTSTAVVRLPDDML